MVTVKSLILELLVLVLLLCPVMYVLSPTDAAVVYGSITPTEARDPSGNSRGALLFDNQTALPDVRADGTTSQASLEWKMQSATVRNLSQGSTAVSTNATRIIVPAAGAQKTVGAAAPSTTSPTLPAWLWVAILVTASVVLAAVFILRTIFQEDEGQAASNTMHGGGESTSEESYDTRGARLIPIEGSEEGLDEVGAKEGPKGRSTRRIHIDDAEPKDHSSDDTEEE
ncbi:MAG: hypothetical protein ACXV6L_07195 [Halobacteriota archaeon]